MSTHPPPLPRSSSSPTVAVTVVRWWFQLFLLLLPPLLLLPKISNGISSASPSTSIAGQTSHSRTIAFFLSHGQVNNWLRLPKNNANNDNAATAGEWLVLGAVNRLYMLDLDNLSLAHEVVTGPVLDSSFCNAELSSCIGPRDSIVETDNWNKLLLPLLNSSNSDNTPWARKKLRTNNGAKNSTYVDALLVCGSTRQGECHLRNFPTLERINQHPALFGHWQHVPVSANHPDATTSALLVNNDRLFVAASSAHENSPYREAFPAVSTRLLTDGLQPVYAGSLDGEAAVHIRAEFRSRLHVRYLYAFRDQYFVYWLAIQPKSAHSAAPLVTRLIRVCLDDDRYTSYSELEVQCRSGEDNALFSIARAGVLHNEQLWVTFTDSDGRQSAICTFPLAKLRLTFWYNIDRCRGGTETIGLPHIGRDAKCTNRSHLPLAEDTCLLGVGGTIEASAPALTILSDRVLTTLDVAEVDGHLLLAAGTSRGEIVQMEAIGDRTMRRLRVYAEYRAAGDPIHKISILGRQQKLLVAAGKEVLLLQISICAIPHRGGDGSSSTFGCTECLSSGDPLCAWCLTLGRCTRPYACPSSTSLMHRCPELVGQIHPTNLSLSAKNSAIQLFLPVAGLNNFDQANANLECVFDQTGLHSPARYSRHPNGFQCPLPSLRPRIPSGHDSMRVQIALRAIGTRTDLLATNGSNVETEQRNQWRQLTLYSCAAYTLCSTCSSAQWPCRWCATQRKCVDTSDWAPECPQEATRPVSPAGCARISPILPGSELLIPFDLANTTALEFHVENLPTGLSLACRLGGQNSSDVRKATALPGGKVRCSPGPFRDAIQEDGNNVMLDKGNKRAIHNISLELLAGQEPMDATTISIYKCMALASDCSRCMALDARFACVWCDGGCRHNEQCTNNHRTAGASAADELCTAATIYSFSPKSGPLEGGTLIEIQGRDLGSSFLDVKDRVQVAGVPCRVVHYEISKRVVCQTGATSTTTRGPVRITIGRSGRRTVESPSHSLGHFHYRSPQPLSVHPGFGPQSGGTRLDIFGEHLDVGRNVSVHLDNLECQLHGERQANQLSCLTAPSTRPYQVTAIRLQIDNAVRLLANAKFDYRPDPIIIDVQPTTAPESGGRQLIVTGENLDALLTPKMFLLSPPSVTDAEADEWELVSDLAACRVLNGTQMSCESPRLALPTALLRQSQLAKWTVGFAMDGVRSVRNMGPRIQLTTVPDAQFSPFVGVYQLQSEQPLMISGQWLNQAASPAEYHVTIGSEECAVFLLEPDRLLCHPPPIQPLATDDAGLEMADGRPLVVVRVGRNRAEIGPLEYADNVTANFPATLWNVRMVSILLFALFAVTFCLIALGWLWRRRQGEHERTYKRIQLQMEQMESQVRQECKQAFAELQTDMLAELDGVGICNGNDEAKTTLTGSIGHYHSHTAAIPLLERREFLARLLLRDAASDPALMANFGCTGIYTSQMPMALAQFDSLLWNRQFLYVFVQMAEEDTAFSASERSTLASLLLISLSRNWAFASDVVLSLLSAHIQHCVLTRQSHLLFRHSESLVEKLFQYWFTISLFPWLHEDQSNFGSNGSLAAKQLFLLYRALKSLTEKGPVDAVTGHARYSLSELNLLRETIDPVQLMLLVVPLDGFDQAPVPVCALDCDTIGQLKGKLLDTIYRNTPYSQRITVDQFDLEWRCPRRGVVLLLDNDQSQQQQRMPTRINTLAHYGVPNQALLAMQARPPTTLSNQQQYTFRSGSSEHSFTLGGWRSSANQLLSASSSSSSSNDSSTPAAAVMPSGAAHMLSPHRSQADSTTTYFHLAAPSTLTHANETINNKIKWKNNKTTCKSDGHAVGAAAAAKRVQPILPEVLLTRLLMCKGTLQRFVDGFFQTALLTDNQPVPIVLKYVFDFLDAQAEQNQCIDADILHAWKSNCWVLRFWQQLLHNPDLLFDIPRQPCLAGSLAVLGQTLVDAFSRSDLALSKESPSSKLLFAREITKYRPCAEQLFTRIRAQPSVPLQHFYDYAESLSKLTSDGLSTTTALGELLNWTKANGIRLVECLEMDAESKRLRLGDRLRQIVESSILLEHPDEQQLATADEHVYATLH